MASAVEEAVSGTTAIAAAAMTRLIFMCMLSSSLIGGVLDARLD